MSKKPKDKYTKTLERANRVYFRTINVVLGALDGYDEVSQATADEHPEGAMVIGLMTGDLRKRIAEELNK